VLHLETSIHFEKIEIPLSVNEKLHGTGVLVARAAGHFNCSASHARTKLCIQKRRGALFDQLLMPPLYRAFPLEQMHDVAVTIAENLKLDVTGLLDETFEIDRRISEARTGFRTRLGERHREIIHGLDDAHALAAATRHGFDEKRKSYRLRFPHRFFIAIEHVGARCNGNSPLAGDASCRRFIPHEREIGVFGQESVPGMNRLSPRLFGDFDDRLHFQVTLRRRSRPNPAGLVGVAYMQGVSVDIRVDSNGTDS
jgi:hypothetical protein